MNKIIIITPHLSTGGCPQFVLKKIELLKEQYETYCVEYNFLSPHFVVQRDKVKGLIGNRFHSLKEHNVELIDIINEIGPEIVWVEEFAETFMSEKDLKFIFGNHRTWKLIESTHTSENLIYKKYNLPDKFIFVSKHSENMYKDMGVEFDTIEYPIDIVETSSAEYRNKLGLEDDYKHVLNVGLFTPGKNQKYAFELAEKLLDYKIKFHFVGNQADNFKEYWEPLMNNKPSNCIIHGEKDNVNEYLQASDLFLFTSTFELNPLVIKEAISYKLPTLMFNLKNYHGNYDNVEGVSFLSGNIESDSQMILQAVELTEKENNGHYDFIEIGTSDFDTLIESCKDSDVGISIEPIPYYLGRLPDKPNVKKIQAALSDSNGFVDIFYIKSDVIEKNNLPWWVRGSNSINRPHPFVVKEIGKELYDELVTIEKVKKITWSNLIKEESIKSIGFLKVDTEGHDHIILNGYLNHCDKNPKLLANKIKFENHNEVSNKEEIEKLIEKFISKGYDVERIDSDVVLYKQKIPRIIHQTFKTKNLPDELLKNVESIKKMNPTFEYRFYDDNDCVDFIKNNYAEEKLQTYLSINEKYGAARADYFRYLLMYKIGGVYLDIKSTTTVPLEETLRHTDEYILSHWPGKDWSDVLNYEFGEFQNWHIICKPGHPFLKKTIELVEENIKNYTDGAGKKNVLFTTGPIPYSKAILSIIDDYKPFTYESVIREYQISEEIGLSYLGTKNHHNEFYNSYSTEEKIIKKSDVKRGYVLYSNEKYFEIVSLAAKSIRNFSELPIYVYMLNSNLKVDVEGVKTIRWDFDFDDNQSGMYVELDSNFYINRKNSNIYKLLIQRPLIVKDVLEKYLDVVAYVDSDSIATPNVDNIFDLYTDLSYPFFVEGTHDYLLINGRGGAESKEDLTSTLEHPACELFNVNQSIRERYRQTGYFVSSKQCLDFMEEWYCMCNHPSILKNNSHYAPYNEETILNVLLWKKEILNGLPYIYVNASEDDVDNVYRKISNGESNPENYNWLRVPKTKDNLLFFHGEKNVETINRTMEKIKEHYGK
jgi:mannosyltransferase OCH1-like enzyme